MELIILAIGALCFVAALDDKKKDVPVTDGRAQPPSRATHTGAAPTTLVQKVAVSTYVPHQRSQPGQENAPARVVTRRTPAVEFRTMDREEAVAIAMDLVEELEPRIRWCEHTGKSMLAGGRSLEGFLFSTPFQEVQGTVRHLSQRAARELRGLRDRVLVPGIPSAQVVFEHVGAACRQCVQQNNGQETFTCGAQEVIRLHQDGTSVLLPRTAGHALHLPAVRFSLGEDGNIVEQRTRS